MATILITFVVTSMFWLALWLFVPSAPLHRTLVSAIHQHVQNLDGSTRS